MRYARVDSLPNVYGPFAGRVGKYLGDYGPHFSALQFPDLTKEEFPKADLVFLEEEGATTSETDRFRRALNDSIIWGQIKQFEPYGKQFYLRKARVRGFYGLNFVRLLGTEFPLGDVEIEVVERNEDFDYRQVAKEKLGASFKEFRVLQYFQDWSEYGLIIDHVEWLYNTEVPMDQRQVLVDRMLKKESIWTYTFLDDARFAEATRESLSLNLVIFSADIRSDMVSDIAKKSSFERDEYIKLYTNQLTGLKRIYDDYLKKRKKMPLSQKVALSVEVFKEISRDNGRPFKEEIAKKASGEDRNLSLEEKQEKFPLGDALVPADRVKLMKNDPGRKLDIEKHPALDRLYDELIKHYTDLLDIWEASRDPYNGIPDVDPSYRDSFSYIYIIGLCMDIHQGLLAFEIEFPSINLEKLRNAFKDAKGVQRYAQRAKGITGNPKRSVEGAP